MRYVDEFRRKNLVHKVAQRINAIAPDKPVNIMEVCGTHTQSFFRFGLDKLLPTQINFISGPGCPVCVSPQEYIDQVIYYSRDKDTIIATFGDMLRVPGTKSSLEKQRGEGADVRIVYSPLDCITIASHNPDKKVIFLAVGFETTAPTIALSIILAKKQKLRNLFFLSSLKVMPVAMDHLLKDRRLNIDGFLCPGHVSSIIGTRAYAFIPRKYKIGCCIAGFEPLDIMEGIHMLLQQINENKPRVDNQYIRVVTTSGNRKAQSIIRKVFTSQDTSWRGLGIVPKSGLKIRKDFSNFDAQINLPYFAKQAVKDYRAQKCRCGEVLKGLIRPDECVLFKKACSPDNPYGPCMVSQEGACNAYYKYR